MATICPFALPAAIRLAPRAQLATPRTLWVNLAPSAPLLDLNAIEAWHVIVL